MVRTSRVSFLLWKFPVAGPSSPPTCFPANHHLLSLLRVHLLPSDPSFSFLVFFCLGVFLTPLCCLERGSDSTDTSHNLQRVLSECSSVVSQLFGQDHEVDADYDALSFLVIADHPLSDSHKRAIRDLFYCFGTRSSRVGFPYTHVASNKNDSIFGSTGNKCQHIDSPTIGKLLLEEGESLTLDVPVKVAIHPSCCQHLVEHFRKKEQPFYLTQSQSPNICVDPNKASSKPDYEQVVEALLEHSHVDVSGDCRCRKHVIHIADLGGRHQISLTDEVSNCKLAETFKTIKKARQSGVVIEVAQFDVAFSAHFRPGRLPRLSLKRTEVTNKWKGVFAGATADTWALHSIEHGGERGGLAAKLQRGTARLKQKRWKDEGKLWIDEESFLSTLDFDAVEYPESLRTLSEWYEAADGDGDRDNLCTNPNTVHSGKTYSSVAHLNLQDRRLLLLTWRELSVIADFTMAKLQRLLAHLDQLNTEVFRTATEFGFKARLEVSVRPLPGNREDEKRLRTQGHLVDLLSHAFLGFHHFLSGQHRLAHDSLTPGRAQAKASLLIRGMQRHVHHRAETKFSGMYPAKSMSCWLAAHISMIMVLLGLACSHNLRFVSDWLRKASRYDPLRQAASLESNNFLEEHEESTPGHAEGGPDARTLPDAVKTAIVDLSQLTDKGKDVLLDYLTTHAHGLAPSAWLCRLSLEDKLVLSVNLTAVLIPGVGHSLAPSESSDEDDDKCSVQMEEVEEDEDVAGGTCHPPYLQPEEVTGARGAGGAEEAGGAGRGGHFQLESNSGCSSHQSLNRLCLLEEVFTPDMPVTILRVCELIRLLHGAELTIPGEGSGVIKLPKLCGSVSQAMGTAGNILETQRASDEVMTTETLSSLCVHLDVPCHGRRDRKTLTESLCLRYWCPCTGVSFDCSRLSSLSDDLKDHLNDLLNKVLRINVSEKLPSAIHGESVYYRHSDGTKLSVQDRDLLVICRPPDFTRALQDGEERFSCQDLCQLCSILEDKESGRSNTGNFRASLHLFLQDSKMENRHMEDIFLTDKGKPSECFRGVSCLSQLEEKNGFCLVPTDEELFFDGHMNLMVPHQVLLPLACLKWGRPIALHDRDNLCTSLHTYQGHPSRVITYDFPSTQVTPSLDCHHFILGHAPHDHVLLTCSRLEPESSAHQSASCMLAATIQRAPNTEHRGLTGHPAKLKKASSAYKSMGTLLRLRYGEEMGAAPNRQSTGDVLGLATYSRLLSRSGVPLCNWFDRSVVQLLGGQANANSVPSRLSSGDVTKTECLADFWVLCITCCAKYGACLAAWVSVGNTKYTQLFLYSPSLRKVTTVHFQAYVHINENPHILYVRANFQSGSTSNKSLFGFWVPASRHEPINFCLPLTDMSEGLTEKITKLLERRHDKELKTEWNHPLARFRAPSFFRLDVEVEDLQAHTNSVRGPTVPNLVVAFPQHSDEEVSHEKITVLCFIFSGLVPRAQRLRHMGQMVFDACGGSRSLAHNLYKPQQIVLPQILHRSSSPHLLYVLTLLAAFHSETAMGLKESCTQLLGEVGVSSAKSWLYEYYKLGGLVDQLPPFCSSRRINRGCHV